MAKGDFYLLGVQMRLLTRCKILEVASFLHCLQIIFSLKSHSPTLKRHMHGSPQLTDLWITSLLFDLNYKYIFTRATLFALVKSVYHTMAGASFFYGSCVQ